MAKKTVEKYYSDLSGEEIDTPSPTVSFVFDGVGYEVDLTASEREIFEKAVAPYIAIGRRAGTRTRSTSRSSGSGTRSTSSSSGSGSGTDAKAVRAWAIENGLDVPARGRVPASLIEAYEGSR